ncbi:MAG: hypothetical protein IJW59_02860 [Clostridia bacterium]|nr:hypothetical protein [Clostridia bacterium]
MKVYRYMSESELQNLQAENYSELGSKYDKSLMKRVNSHSYKKGVKYLHFFKNKEDVFRICSLKNDSPENFYVGEFDIPIYILIQGIGKGYYDCKGCDIGLDEVVEFKMPTKYMNKKYLKSATLDSKRLSERINFESFGIMFFSDINNLKDEEFDCEK